MERPRLRPLFKLVLPIEAPRLRAEIRQRLQVPRARFVGKVLRRHVELTVRDEDRHLWSPHLSLDIFADRDDGEPWDEGARVAGTVAGTTTTLRGRYGPHPSLWTFLMAVHGVLLMLALAATVYGLSQWNLGWSPWALWLLPLCAALTALTWLFGALGQRMASHQMHELQAFLEDCVRRASDPPPPGEG